MNKNIYKLLAFLNHNKVAVGLFLFVLFFTISAGNSYASTCDLLNIGGCLDNGLGFILSGVGIFFISVAALILQGAFVVIVGLTSWLVDSQPIQTAWILIRDLVNMTFIFFLLYASIAKLIGKENILKRKKVISQIVWILIGAFLVNFSKVFFGIIIDISQIVTLQFVNAFQSSLGNFTSVFEKTILKGPNSGVVFGVFLIIFALIFFAVCVSIIIYFLIRAVSLGIYTAMSPLYFLFMSVPFESAELKKLQQGTTDKFIQLAIGGPMLAFYLWISLMLFSGPDNILSHSSGGLNISTNDTDPDKGIDPNTHEPKPSMQGGDIMAMLVAIVVMIFVQKKALDMAKDAGSVLGKGFTGMIDKAGKVGMAPLNASKEILKEKAGNLKDSASSAVGKIPLVKGAGDWVENLRKNGEERAKRNQDRKKLMAGGDTVAGRAAIREHEAKALANTKLGTQNFMDAAAVTAERAKGFGKKVLSNTGFYGMPLNFNSKEYNDKTEAEKANLKALEAQQFSLSTEHENAVKGGDVSTADAIKAKMKANQEAIDESRVKLNPVDPGVVVSELERKVNTANKLQNLNARENGFSEQVKNLEDEISRTSGKGSVKKKKALEARKQALEDNIDEIREDRRATLSSFKPEELRDMRTPEGIKKEGDRLKKLKTIQTTAQQEFESDRQKVKEGPVATSEDKLKALQANRDRVEAQVKMGQKTEQDLDFANARINEEQKRIDIGKKKKEFKSARESLAIRDRLSSGQVSEEELEDKLKGTQKYKDASLSDKAKMLADYKAKMLAANESKDAGVKANLVDEISSVLKLSNNKDVQKAEKAIGKAEKDYGKAQEATKKSANVIEGVEVKDDKSTGQQAFEKAQDSVKADGRYINEDTQKYDANLIDGRNYTDVNGEIRSGEVNSFLAAMLSKIEAGIQISDDEKMIFSDSKNQKNLERAIENYDKDTIEKFNKISAGTIKNKKDESISGTGLGEITAKSGETDKAFVSQIDKHLQDYLESLKKMEDQNLADALRDRLQQSSGKDASGNDIPSIVDKIEAAKKASEKGEDQDGLLALYKELQREQKVLSYTTSDGKGFDKNGISSKDALFEDDSVKSKFNKEIQALRARYSSGVSSDASKEFSDFQNFLSSSRSTARAMRLKPDEYKQKLYKSYTDNAAKIPEEFRELVEEKRQEWAAADFAKGGVAASNVQVTMVTNSAGVSVPVYDYKDNTDFAALQTGEAIKQLSEKFFKPNVPGTKLPNDLNIASGSMSTLARLIGGAVSKGQNLSRVIDSNKDLSGNMKAFADNFDKVSNQFVDFSRQIIEEVDPTKRQDALVDVIAKLVGKVENIPNALNAIKVSAPSMRPDDVAAFNVAVSLAEAKLKKGIV